MPRQRWVDPLSGTALHIVPLFNEVSLASATGFTVNVRGVSYLITNWHVVSGRNADTGACLDRNAAIPNKLAVAFHSRGEIGKWRVVDIPLVSADGERAWIEHPLGRAVDVVAIRLPYLPLIDVFPLDMELTSTDIVVMPAMPISVIGYPLGLRSGDNWPIWKTGHVASDPDIDFELDRPAFLIDATTRSGMSGSPVVLRLSGGYTTTRGDQVLGGGVVTKFMGIYSGRIHADAEIGRVWRPFVIQEIIEGKLLFDDRSLRFPPGRNSSCPCRNGKRFKRCCGSFAVEKRHEEERVVFIFKETRKINLPPIFAVSKAGVRVAFLSTSRDGPL